MAINNIQVGTQRRFQKEKAICSLVIQGICIRLHSIALPTRFSLCFAVNQKYFLRKTIAQCSAQGSPEAVDLVHKFS